MREANRYKVGDKVRFILDTGYNLFPESYEKWYGQVGTISKVKYAGNGIGWLYQVAEVQEDTPEKEMNWNEWAFKGLAFCPSGTINIEFGSSALGTKANIGGKEYRHATMFKEVDSLDDMRLHLYRAIDRVIENENKRKEAQEEQKRECFSFEEFKRGNFAVNCRTEEEANLFLAYLAGKGLEWISGDSLCKMNCWSDCKDKTRYANLDTVGVYYGSIKNTSIPYIIFFLDMLK